MPAWKGGEVSADWNGGGGGGPSRCRRAVAPPGGGPAKWSVGGGGPENCREVKGAENAGGGGALGVMCPLSGGGEGEPWK